MDPIYRPAWPLNPGLREQKILDTAPGRGVRVKARAERKRLIKARR
jgi:hypothetical protein